jgi:hypothetical protein
MKPSQFIMITHTMAFCGLRLLFSQIFSQRLARLARTLDGVNVVRRRPFTSIIPNFL